MNRRDALRLSVGDRVGFGHSKWTFEIDRAGSYEEGVVLHVTPKGGIRVMTDAGVEDW